MGIMTREASAFTRYSGATTWYNLVPTGVTIPRDAIVMFIAMAASCKSINKEITCSSVS